MYTIIIATVSDDITCQMDCVCIDYTNILYYSLQQPVSYLINFLV